MFYLTTHSTHFLIRLYGVGKGLFREHIPHSFVTPVVEHWLEWFTMKDRTDDPPPPAFLSERSYHGATSRSFVQYFSFQPVLHDWCNKGRGICHPVCGMMHIK